MNSYTNVMISYATTQEARAFAAQVVDTTRRLLAPVKGADSAALTYNIDAALMGPLTAIGIRQKARVTQMVDNEFVLALEMSDEATKGDTVRVYFSAKAATPQRALVDLRERIATCSV